MSAVDTDAEKPVGEVWYGVEACGDGIIRFREHHIDSFAVGDIWLVRGRDGDLAIDTGTGIVPSAPLIEAIVGRQVTAVALNSYYDHAGGWSGFAERACHPLEAPELADPYAENESVFDYLNETTLRALPRTGFDVRSYAMKGASPTRLVQDGDIFDLGDRRLDVLHVPGRSPGGLAIWEAATGSLFTSDMLYDGDHGFAWPPEDPEAYIKSLQRMRDLPVKTVYPGHYGIMSRDRMLEIIEKQLSDLARRCRAR